MSTPLKPITFCKMHGLGNDFVVIDRIHQSIDLNRIPIALWADRHRGIGFDQLLLITPSNRAQFACQIFNADGSEAEQCGNGMRCVARFIHENQLTYEKSFTIETKNTITSVVIQDYNTITVTMDNPSTPQIIELNLKNQTLLGMTLSMGNPHTILQVTPLATCPVSHLGSEIAALPLFPESCNVGFMEIIDRQHIHLRTFERGVGETLACGSNACAAVVTGIRKGLLDPKVMVSFEYGHLWIEWENEESPVKMTGPATHVFMGRLDHPSL